MRFLPCFAWLFLVVAAVIIYERSRRRYPDAKHVAQYSWETSVFWLLAALSMITVIAGVALVWPSSITMPILGALTLASAIWEALSRRSRHQLIHRHCVCRKCHYIRDPQPEGPCPECGSDCGTVGPVKE